MDAAVKARQKIERKIVTAFVKSALRAGHRITVSYERGYDVDDCLLGSTDLRKIIEAAFAVDECHLFVHHKDGPLFLPRKPHWLAPTVDKQLVSMGWVFLIFGESGWDVVNDHTVSLDTLMVEANKVSDRYQ